MIDASGTKINWPIVAWSSAVVPYGTLGESFHPSYAGKGTSVATYINSLFRDVLSILSNELLSSELIPYVFYKALWTHIDTLLTSEGPEHIFMSPELCPALLLWSHEVQRTWLRLVNSVKPPKAEYGTTMITNPDGVTSLSEEVVVVRYCNEVRATRLCIPGGVAQQR